MALRIVGPGLSTTVQDGGRTGYRAWGVPPGGAFDRASAGLANALVGNPADAAVLEMTLLGGTYEALAPMGLALAGAPMAAALRNPQGDRRPLAIPSSFPIAPGEILEIGGTPRGCRTYLAVAGGWRSPLVLGSRSSERPLRAGEVVDARPGATLRRRLVRNRAADARGLTIRIIAGPDAEASGPVTLDSAAFRVGRASDRMGLRLEGEPVAVVAEADRISTPVAPGAIQVAGGQLLVLGVACGTVGGYPHLAHVISADLDRLGQARPGDRLTFQLIGVQEARRIDRRRRAHQAAHLDRIRALAAGADRAALGD